MSKSLTIISITGTPNYDIYVCDNTYNNCVFISNISDLNLPYTFFVPNQYNSGNDSYVKIIDSNGCVYLDTYLFPTPMPTNTPQPTPNTTPNPTITINPLCDVQYYIHTATPIPTTTPFGQTVTPSPTGPTPTPTPSKSPFPTFEPTPTPSRTLSPTLAATNTPSPSPTQIGQTPDPTNTPTPSPTVTNSPTPTVTNTPLPTVTNTPTPTVTNTPLPTVTNTPIPTVTNTPLPTVTNTPIPTVTNTPIPTVTNTPIPTVTNTPTPSKTPSPPTPNPTPNPTPQPTPNPTPGPTPAPTPSCIPQNSEFNIVNEIVDSVINNITPINFIDTQIQGDLPVLYSETFVATHNSLINENLSFDITTDLLKSDLAQLYLKVDCVTVGCLDVYPYTTRSHIFSGITVNSSATVDVILSQSFAEFCGCQENKIVVINNSNDATILGMSLQTLIQYPMLPGQEFTDDSHGITNDIDIEIDNIGGDCTLFVYHMCTIYTCLQIFSGYNIYNIPINITNTDDIRLVLVNGSHC